MSNTAQLMPNPKLQFFYPGTQLPLVGGLLNTYIAGSSTPLATYTDATASTPNTNPIVLDSNGACTVFLSNAAYKFVLTDSSGNVLWTVDNVSLVLPGFVTNTMLATMAQNTIKGRIATGTGAPQDLTAAQATSLLSTFVGDTGSGGVKGLTPAPPANSTAQNMYQRADGTFKNILGNVVSKSSDYAANGYDDVVIATTAITVTLWDATATAFAGRELMVIHQASQFAQITIATTLAQQITYKGVTYSSGGITLCTTGEVIVFRANGTGWIITEHDCETGWIADTTANVQWYAFTVPGGGSTAGATYTDGNGNTFTTAQTNTNLNTTLYAVRTAGSASLTSTGTLTKATGAGVSSYTYTAVVGATNPTGTTTNPVFNHGFLSNFNSLFWRRKSNKTEFWYNLYQPSAGSANGAGDWIWQTPTGMQNIDPTYAPTNAGVAQTSLDGLPVLSQYKWPLLGSAEINSVASWAGKFAIPYSTNSFIAYGDYSSSIFIIGFTGIITANASVGAIYSSPNGQQFTVKTAVVTGTPSTLSCTGVGLPDNSGTLTKVSGTGDSTITFTAYSVTPPTPAISSVALGSTYWPSNAVISANFKVEFPIAGWLP